MVSWNVLSHDTVEVPSERWAHSLTNFGNTSTCLLFGGFAHAKYLSDVWILRPAPRFSHSHNPMWIKPFPVLGMVPPSRSNHAAISLNTSQVIISGGGGEHGIKYDDMFKLTLEGGVGLSCQQIPVLHVGTTGISSSVGGGDSDIGACSRERSFHAGAPLRENVFCLFGGSSSTCADTDDLRICTLDQANNRCLEETFVIKARAGAWPSPRRLHAMALYEQCKAVVLHGGCVGAQFDPLGDTWVLQEPLEQGQLGCVSSRVSAGLSLAWESLPCVGSIPPPRCGHSLTAVQGSNTMVLFGGTVEVPDCTSGVALSFSSATRHGAVARVNSSDLFILLLVQTATGSHAAEPRRPRVSHLQWSRVGPTGTVPRALHFMRPWPSPRRRHGASMLDGQFIVFGGYDGAHYLGDTLHVAYDIMEPFLVGSAETCTAARGYEFNNPIPTCPVQSPRMIGTGNHFHTESFQTARVEFDPYSDTVSKPLEGFPNPFDEIDSLCRTEVPSIGTLVEEKTADTCYVCTTSIESIQQCNDAAESCGHQRVSTPALICSVDDKGKFARLPTGQQHVSFIRCCC